SMEITYCHNKASIVTELIKLSSEYRNWLLSLCACCMNLPIIILGALWGDMYLQKIFNFTHIQASYIITMMFVGFLIGAPILGLISDWIYNRKIVILGSSIVGLILLVNITHLQQLNLNLAMALFFCIGFFISAQSLCYTFITEINSLKIKNTAIGFAAVIVTLGGAVFQSIFTYILSITNSAQNNNFKSAFIFLLVSITASIVFSLAIQSDNNKNSREV
ncbi:MAG: MFS transporter, partial [Ignavibacteriae bacterium]|nr:MFS transporter [Ignavibacteriota bacterium]